MPPLTAEQHAIRRGWVGASEIAAVCGVSRWAKPIDVWLEKTGRSAPQPEDPRAAIGLRAESVLLNWYLDDTGRALADVTRGTSVGHPRHAFMGCTPDFLVHEDGELVRLVQMKCVGARMAIFWPDETVPDDVECQVQHEMEVTGAPVADVVAWLGGTDFRIHTLERDREFGAMLVEGARSFWKCVVDDAPPPIDGSESWRKYLTARFPVVEREELDQATEDVDRWAHESLRARDRIDEAECDQDAADNHLRLLIGERRGFLGTDYIVTWDADKNGKRSLRVKRRNQLND